MHDAFKTLEMGYSNCIIVGSDSFDLKAIIIETAFKELLNYEVVMVLQKWWLLLLGLKKRPRYLQNKDWEQLVFLKRQ
jgi:glycosyltransferase A (GT-A) superfamily protein (DUF2064 family)